MFLFFTNKWVFCVTYRHSLVHLLPVGVTTVRIPARFAPSTSSSKQNHLCTSLLARFTLAEGPKWVDIEQVFTHTSSLRTRQVSRVVHSPSSSLLHSLTPNTAAAAHPARHFQAGAALYCTVCTAPRGPSRRGAGPRCCQHSRHHPILPVYLPSLSFHVPLMVKFSLFSRPKQPFSEDEMLSFQ